MNRKIFTILSFAMMMFMVGIWAATAGIFPATADLMDDLEVSSFLPMIFTEYTSSVPSGALYVFSTTATTVGNAGGRPGMNALCAAEDVNAHFCNQDEIMHAFQTTGVYFENPFEKSWLDNVVLSESWQLSDTCLSWTSALNTYEGTEIKIHAVQMSTYNCDATQHVTCCKWIP